MYIISLIGCFTIVYFFIMICLFFWCLYENHYERYENHYAALVKEISAFKAGDDGIDILPAIFVERRPNKRVITISWIRWCVVIKYVLKTNTDIEKDIEKILNK